MGHNGKTLLIQFLYTYFLILYYYSDKKVVVRLKSLPPRQAKTAKYLQPANSLPYPRGIRRAHTIIAPKSMKAKQFLFRGFRLRFRISSSSASKLCPFGDTHPTALGTGEGKGGLRRRRRKRRRRRGRGRRRSAVARDNKTAFGRANPALLLVQLRPRLSSRPCLIFRSKIFVERKRTAEVLK